jgi:hypothetical protein
MADSLHIDPRDFNQDTPDLDFRPILDIHRGDPEGEVAFMRKNPDGGNLESVGSVKVKDVREMLPGILAQFIDYDGYFSVNSMYRRGNPMKRFNGLPYPIRTKKNTYELAACYADLDVGRPDEEHKRKGASMDWQDAQIEALQRQRDGIIPPFSMMACSGRGVYLFWLLVDDTDREKLPRGYPSNQLRYKAINKALHRRLYGLGIDQAHDAQRVLAAPGTLKTKVMKRVSYSITIQGDNGGRIEYSIPELEQWLKIESPEASLPLDLREKAKDKQFTRGEYKKQERKGSHPKRAASYRAPNANRAQDLETIEQWRGGWLRRDHTYPDGHKSSGRGFMLKLYAQYLRKAGKDRNDVLKAVTIMAANCKPRPYPEDKGSDTSLAEIVEIAFSNDRDKHFSNVKTERLLKWLGINEDTDPDLLDSLSTSTLPKAIRDQREKAIPRQADFTEQRRQAIINLVELKSGNIPTLAKMKTLLADMDILNPDGKPWSTEIIRQDYNSIGYPAPRRGRPKRSILNGQ